MSKLSSKEILFQKMLKFSFQKLTFFFRNKRRNFQFHIILYQMNSFSRGPNFDLKKYCIANTRTRRERNTAPLRTSNLKDSFQIASKNTFQGCDATQEIKESLCKTMEKAMQIYACNLEFYRTYSQKFQNVILSQLKEKNYLEGKKISEFFKNKGEVIFTKKNNLKTFEEELKAFGEFLLEHYQRKRMKQISIICDNIKEQEKIISNKTDIYQYEDIYSQLELKTSKSRNFDFIGQYQQICTNYGIPDTNIRPHLHIKTHLESSKENVIGLFENTKVEKEKRKFIIKKKLRSFENY